MSDDQSFVYDGFDVSDPEMTGWDGQGAGGPTVSEGEHLFEVVSCKIVNTKKNDGRNFEVEYRTVGGPDAGETVKVWYLCQGEKFGRGHKGRIVHVFRNALRVPLNATGGFETKDTIGRQMYATVTHESYEKYLPETQTTKTYTNAALSMERPVEDEATQAQAQASSKAPSAPPSRPPAAPRPPAPPAARPSAPPARPR